MVAVATVYPECQALCDLANDAANHAQTIWLGFLSFGTFLVVAVAGTTHAMLLLETPISLPLLSINLDLIGFYIAAPILLIVLHLYLLLKLVLLSEAYANFEAQVARDISFSVNRAQMRKHLNTTIFLQCLRQKRQGRRLMSFLLTTLLALTLVVGPIVALLYTQIRFLPYQSEWVTWLHRILLVADVLVIAAAYEAVLRNGSLGRPRVVRWIVYSLAGLCFVLCGALVTFPGESIDNNPVARAFYGEHDGGDLQTTSLHGLFPTSIQVPDQDFVDDMKVDLDKVTATLVLRNRGFVGADLRGVDLREAVLSGADLRGADLSGAFLERALLHGDEISREATKLEGASLNGAWLQGASLDNAQMRGASLDGAWLQGASLDRAELQGASLNGAQLQGASLKYGALHGASLEGAELQGASLFGAQLQGASLDGTELQGAFLDGAQLQGASLNRAQLQGASLNGAQLQGASLAGTYVWRTAIINMASLSEVFLGGAWIADLEMDPIQLDLSAAPYGFQPLDEETVHASIADWLKSVPEGNRKENARTRLAGLFPTAREPEADRAILEFWSEAQRNSSLEEYLEMRVQVLRNDVCLMRDDRRDKPYTVEGVIRHVLESLDTDDLDSGSLRLAVEFDRMIHDATACPSAADIDSTLVAELKETVTRIRRKAAADRRAEQ